MVFQNYALFPHMTVSDNVGFPLKMRKIARQGAARSASTRALELVRLPGYGERYPNQLSGGQQQRVALARALVFNPPVLLMDEPLGALDKKLREEMQLEIKRIQSELGITTIYVTHDQEEALVMSDRIAVMNLGQIEQIDTPASLYEHPATRFVADFIGESNLIPITLRQDNGASRVEAPGQTPPALPRGRRGGRRRPHQPGGPAGEGAAGRGRSRPRQPAHRHGQRGDLRRRHDQLPHQHRRRLRDSPSSGTTAPARQAIAVADSVRVGWRADDGSLV